MRKLNFCKEKEVPTNMNQFNFVVERKWYSIYNQSKVEKIGYESLVKQNTSTFLPLEIFQNQWGNSINKIKNPFFNLYEFLKTANNSLIGFLEVSVKNYSRLLKDML